MPDDHGPRIHVTAAGHPDRDDWTDAQAADEAAKTGRTLGAYLGRERDAYPDPPDWLFCHVYAASEGDGGAG